MVANNKDLQYTTKQLNKHVDLMHMISFKRVCVLVPTVPMKSKTAMDKTMKSMKSETAMDKTMKAMKSKTAIGKAIKATKSKKRRKVSRAAICSIFKAVACVLQCSV